MYRLIICSSFFLMMFGDVHSQSQFKQFFYENGTVSSEGMMEAGRPNGYWKTFFPNGEIQSEGLRTNFELDSIWNFYTENGIKTQEITYRNGKKNGETITFKIGVKYLSEQYVSEKRQGFSQEFYPTGEVRRKIPFVDDVEKGIGYEYNYDGMIITINSYDEGFIRRSEKVNRYDKKGKKRGTWKTFYTDSLVSMEGYYMNDLKNGIFKTYDKKGNLLSLEKYKDGQLVVDSEQSIVLDLKSTYYSNGKVKSSGGYVDGKKEGTHRVYDEEGNILGGEVYSYGVKTGEGIIDKSGDLEGDWKLYYDTGELKAEGSYIKNERDGDWIFYHKNGKIEHKGKYAKGLAQGGWTWYFDDGKLRREEYYRRGKEDGQSEEFDEEGNIISQGEYINGLREGEWFYHVGDQTERGYYLDGDKQGFWKHTYENGKTSFQGEFMVGLEVGKHKWYYPDGQIKLEGKYSSGVRVGVWDSYDKEGIRILEIKYKYGQEYKINGRKVGNPKAEALEEEI